MLAIGRHSGTHGAFGDRFRTVALWRSVLAHLLRRLKVQRQRRALADLTPSQLEDIGLTPAQARRESQVPFWAPLL